MRTSPGGGNLCAPALKIGTHSRTRSRTRAHALARKRTLHNCELVFSFRGQEAFPSDSSGFVGGMRATRKPSALATPILTDCLEVKEKWEVLIIILC